MNEIQRSEKDGLIEKRDQLRERLDSIANDYKRGLDPDSEEQAVQLENAEVLEAIAKSTADELHRVEERLAELD